ncbi:hypothetical protein Patl1_02420 [Pistacia atlantica]|uniref:Uncharacterized protein n=1 Tax=Pistacia atlantica TaxID=434234 RepID=A0ACC1CAK3_9ROSI|nr:hypothetical protein Patl1_02420 [Pistacia atlantica]
MALCAPIQKLSPASSLSNGNNTTPRRTRKNETMLVRMTASSDVGSVRGGTAGTTQMGWRDTSLSSCCSSHFLQAHLHSSSSLALDKFLSGFLFHFSSISAEKNNIPWREMSEEILESDVYKEMESVQNPSTVYPDYYLSPFHAYDEGNLSWLAAAEAEAADLSMTRRAIPFASSVDEANRIMRGTWLEIIKQHHQQYSGEIRDILDIGCSVGVSTGFLAHYFHSAKVTGLDLSPYFLAVAQYKEKRGTPRKNPISWIHANGEDTGLPSKSYDLISFSYVLHECPERAIIGLLREAFRLLRHGGTIALNDIAPKSKTLQELSPVLFTLMKSTEPFLDEYSLTDLEGRMKEVGFVNIKSVLTDPRHRTVTASVPHTNKSMFTLHSAAYSIFCEVVLVCDCILYNSL